MTSVIMKFDMWPQQLSRQRVNDLLNQTLIVFTCTEIPNPFTRTEAADTHHSAAQFFFQTYIILESTKVDFCVSFKIFLIGVYINGPENPSCDGSMEAFAS